MAMIYALGEVSGAHFNPVVTIGLWTARPMRARMENVGFSHVVADDRGADLNAVRTHVEENVGHLGRSSGALLRSHPMFDDRNRDDGA